MLLSELPISRRDQLCAQAAQAAAAAEAAGMHHFGEDVYLDNDDEDYDYDIDDNDNNQKKRKTPKGAKNRAPSQEPVGKDGACRNQTGFIGVRMRKWGMFAAEIRDGDKRRWLGSFSSGAEAGMAYDAAAMSQKGCKAKTNFQYLDMVSIPRKEAEIEEKVRWELLPKDVAEKFPIPPDFLAGNGETTRGSHDDIAHPPRIRPSKGKNAMAVDQGQNSEEAEEPNSEAGPHVPAPKRSRSNSGTAGQTARGRRAGAQSRRQQEPEYYQQPPAYYPAMEVDAYPAEQEQYMPYFHQMAYGYDERTAAGARRGSSTGGAGQRGGRGKKRDSSGAPRPPPTAAAAAAARMWEESGDAAARGPAGKASTRGAIPPAGMYDPATGVYYTASARYSGSDGGAARRGSSAGGHRTSEESPGEGEHVLPAGHHPVHHSDSEQEGVDPNYAFDAHHMMYVRGMATPYPAAVHHAHMAYGADPGVFPSPVMFPFGALPYGYQMCYPNGEGGPEHYDEDDEDDMAQDGDGQVYLERWQSVTRAGANHSSGGGKALPCAVEDGHGGLHSVLKRVSRSTEEQGMVDPVLAQEGAAAIVAAAAAAAAHQQTLEQESR